MLLLIVVLDEPPPIVIDFPGSTPKSAPVINDPATEKHSSDYVEKMPMSDVVPGSDVETIPTTNRTISDVFVTSKNHNSAWAKERRHHWKDEGATAVINKNYGPYIATKNNIDRMKQGKAPIGWDEKSVELHHTNGIANNFYDYTPVTRTEHRWIHYGK